jgi:hypothetical protein
MRVASLKGTGHKVFSPIVIVDNCDQVKINNFYTYCEQVGRRGKDYETKTKKKLT